MVSESQTVANKESQHVGGTEDVAVAVAVAEPVGDHGGAWAPSRAVSPLFPALIPVWVLSGLNLLHIK